MAQNRKRAFEGLYAQLEETDGHAVLFSARGESSVIFEMANPVQQLCTDAEQYLRFQDVLSNLMKAIAAVIVLVGAFNVYFKMQNGDQDVKKTIMLTIGGCIAFIALSEALPLFFT